MSGEATRFILRKPFVQEMRNEPERGIVQSRVSPSRGSECSNGEESKVDCAPMTITILTGLPGVGKTERLILAVAEAEKAGRPTATFLCGDSPRLRSRPNLTKHRSMRSRSGLRTQVDHFVSADRCIELLNAAQPNALLAFDEASHFGKRLVEHWCAAAGRGAELLIAAPSGPQLTALGKQGHHATHLTLSCQACARREATQFFVHDQENRTESVCQKCFRRMQAQAKKEIIDCLRSGKPYPGTKAAYQPIELPECRKWQVNREDSQRRLDLMRSICADEGLPQAHSSYLDVGCNTGFFCYGMARAGFTAKGVDVTANDIRIARLLSTYFRRDLATYEVANAYKYLGSAPDERFDVTSAFSVFQWVMIQGGPERGLECMRRLFQKTKRLCVLEMGESSEAHYGDRIGMDYDSAWIQDFMQAEGGFARVQCLQGSEHQLWRDLLIGFKA